VEKTPVEGRVKKTPEGQVKKTPEEGRVKKTLEGQAKKTPIDGRVKKTPVECRIEKTTERVK
jgi:hypothetical protein